MISDWFAFLGGITVALMIAYSPIVPLSWAVPGILFDQKSALWERLLKIFGGIPYWGFYIIFLVWAFEQEIITTLAVLVSLHHVIILSMMKD